MAGIEIKDLTESIELDREAMSSIYGGSKTPLDSDLARLKKPRQKDSLLFFSDKSRKLLRKSL